MGLGRGVDAVVKEADDEVDVGGVGAMCRQCLFYPTILGAPGVPPRVRGDLIADVVGIQGEHCEVAIGERVHRRTTFGAVARKVKAREVTSVAVHGVGGFHVVVAGGEHPWCRRGTGLDGGQVHIPYVGGVELVESLGRVAFFSDELRRFARSGRIGVGDITGEDVEVGPRGDDLIQHVGGVRHRRVVVGLVVAVVVVTADETRRSQRSFVGALIPPSS